MSSLNLSHSSSTTVPESSTPSFQDVVRTARRLALHLAKGSDPEDLTQEAVIRYYEECQRGRRPEALNAWLRRTIDNLAIDDFRRRQGRGKVKRQTPQDIDDVPARYMIKMLTRSPSMHVVEAELAERVLGKLSDRDRRLVKLRWEGMSSKTVAVRLKMAPATVDQAYKRAIARLRAALESDTELLRDLGRR